MRLAAATAAVTVTTAVFAGPAAAVSLAASSDSGNAVVGFAFLAVLLGMYLIPAFVASGRKHRQTGAIWVLNLFLGWTLIGWVIALVWACTNDRTAPSSAATPAPPSADAG